MADYLTLVYQIDLGCRRLLWIGEKRTQETLNVFFKEFKVLDTQFAECRALTLLRANQVEKQVTLFTIK